MSGPHTVLTAQSFESFLLNCLSVSEDLLRVVQREKAKNSLSLTTALLSLNLVDEDRLTQLLSTFVGLPLAPLEEGPPLLPTLASFLSQDLLTSRTWLPFKKEGNALHIAVADPLNEREMGQLRYQLSEFECLFYVAPASQIEEKFLRHTLEKKQSLQDLFILLDTSSLPLPSLESAELIPRILDRCLEDAVQKQASDIHLEPENKFIQIRLRMDGQLSPYHAFHKDFWDSFCVHLKVCAHMNIAETRLPQNGRFSRKINGKEVDFRISSHPTKHGESMVIRVLDRLRALLALEEIGFPRPTIIRLQETLQAKQGLFIVSGPTGSGKTTTLYSILNYLNTTHRNIMTLEQPIEYELPFIRQTEIPENSLFTFANGVRSILRQDPDILFIGEVRDPDTAQMALRASMTGHQVYTTLHAPRALGAIQRLADLGITSTVLANNLKGLLSQRLLRQLCLKCRERRPLTQQEISLLEAPDTPAIYEPTGCPECNQTGYKGRFPVVEFISCTDAFNHLILEKAPLSVLEKEARKTGYIPLHEQGITHLLEGHTSFSELCSIIPLERETT